MTNLTNTYVFPPYISFHDKLDTDLTHSLKDEEMMLRNLSIEYSKMISNNGL